MKKNIDSSQNIKAPNTQNYFIIAFFIFIIITFISYNYENYALFIISIFLSLTSLILYITFFKKTRYFQTEILNNNIIASFSYTKKEWKDFLKYEDKEKSTHYLLSFILLSVITTVIFLIFIVFIDEKLEMFITLLIILGIYLFSLIILPKIIKKTRKEQETKITIFKKGLIINSTIHFWASAFSKLENVKKYDTKFPRIEITYNYLTNRGEYHYTIIIPIFNKKHLESSCVVLKELKKK